MIGSLPNVLSVNDVEYKIRSDYNIALLIFEAYNDPELSEREKVEVCLTCLYEEKPPDKAEALKQAIWFLDGGDMPKSKPLPYKLMDWKQDEQILFSAVNKVAGYETRKAIDLHWWTFLGFFNEISEGLWSQVMNIRSKKAKGKKLEKYEKEFYQTHKSLVDLREPLTLEDEEEQAYINSLI